MRVLVEITVVLGVIGLIVWWVVVPLSSMARSRAAFATDQNNLRQIGHALHAFADAHGGTAPCAVAYRGPDGKALLSWRVALLPYIGEAPLYREFHLDEPWDSPHNSLLVERIPKPYQDFHQAPGPEGLTRYLGVSGRGAAFDEKYPGCRAVPGSTLRLGRSLINVPEGSKTLLVVAVPEGVPWTKPVDFDIDDGPIWPRLMGPPPAGTCATTAGREVQTLIPSGEGRWHFRIPAKGRPDAK